MIMRVTISGWARTVSFHPASFGSGGTTGSLNFSLPVLWFPVPAAACQSLA
jgi:hypothetical protein